MATTSRQECCACLIKFGPDKFSKNEWNKPHTRRCYDCIKSGIGPVDFMGSYESSSESDYGSYFCCICQGYYGSDLFNYQELKEDNMICNLCRDAFN